MKNKQIAEKLGIERRKIDEIDNVLIDFIDKRLEVIKIVGEIKKQNNIPIFNAQRELEILNKAENKKNAGQIKNILKKIMDESKVIQEELIQEEVKTCGH